MAKLMTLRYSGKCRKCRQVIPAGDQGYWLGHKLGVHCLKCHSEHPAPGTEVPRPVSSSAPRPDKPIPADHRLSFDFGELKSVYLDERHSFTLPENQRTLERHRKEWARDSSFYGCTSSEMRKWLMSGFPVEGLEVPPPDLLPNRKKRRIQFSEDGELQLDLALSGFDYPFLEWQKRDRKPGMRVEIGFDFNAYTPSSTIVAYEKWLARLLWTLEEIGYDLDVSLILRTENSWHGVSGPWTVAMRVKKENEASDFAQWSAAFSPGGFRHLGFLAIQIAGDKLGKITSSGLGRAVPRNWNVSYSSNDRILTISQGNSSYDSKGFPEALMTEKLQDALTKIQVKR